MISSAGPIRASISLGMAAPGCDDLGSGAELIAESDARLYEATRAGRNRTVC